MNVKRAAFKEELQKASTGALGSILKQHASSVLVTEGAGRLRPLDSALRSHADNLPLPAATIWVGAIPARVVQSHEAEHAERQLSALFGQFGAIVSITVRKKAGTNKSWALVRLHAFILVGKQVLKDLRAL